MLKKLTIMLPKNNAAPTDLVELLVSNYQQNKPLLSDAVLMRGTRLPDQSLGSYDKSVTHGSLLPQVAASYTHNWSESSSYIGTYAIDREKTRFFADFGLEQALQGKAVQSYSVKDAENMLEPLVRQVAEAKNLQARGAAEERLESFIKRNLYEANVPIRQADGSFNRPKELFEYGGRPNIGVRQAAMMQMKKLTPAMETTAKAVMRREHRSPAMNAIHGLLSTSHQSAAAQKGLPVRKALEVVMAIATKEHQGMLAQHENKPLAQFLDAAAKSPMSPEQERLGRFAKAIAEGLSHPSAPVQAKAEALVQSIAKMDPASAAYADLVKASKEHSSSAQATPGVKAPAPTKQSTASTMDR